VNIDWSERESSVGPPPHRRVPRAAFLRDARRAGLALAGEHGFLPHQYFFVLRRRRGRAGGAGATLNATLNAASETRQR
jgi:hypothetical protein